MIRRRSTETPSLTPRVDGARCRIVLAPMLAAALALAGCGGGLIAPEDAQSNAFLNKVDANCGTRTIGTSSIGYLLDVSQTDDTTFIDETAKLADGLVTPEAYRGMINSFYPGGDNGPAVDCVLRQLEP